jgi:hypothetical protein
MWIALDQSFEFPRHPIRALLKNDDDPARRASIPALNGPEERCVLVHKPVPNLPPDMRLDATVAEAMAFGQQSAASVFRKIRDGRYESFKDGDNRRITWASILKDRQRLIEQGPQLSPTTGKRGRPKTKAAEREPSPRRCSE